MATTRLRQTFKYPSEDEDDSDVRDELDEEEQESLIHTLRDQNALQNTHYTLLFTILPLAATTLYIPSLLGLTSQRSPPLLSLLSITSLLSTAYIMWLLPLPKPADPKGKGPLRPPPRRRQRLGLGLGESGAAGDRFGAGLAPEEGGPVHRYLAGLNGVIAGLLGVVAVVQASKGSSGGSTTGTGMFWGFGAVPGVLLGIVVVVRRMMGEVDIKELEGLRYEYKGA